MSAVRQRGPHRSEIPQRELRSPPDLPSQQHVRDARVYRPGTRAGATHAEHEIAATLDDRRGNPFEIGARERAVAVHEAHHIGGRGEESRVAGGAEPADRFVDDARAPRRARPAPCRPRMRCSRRSRRSRAVDRR